MHKIVLNVMKPIMYDNVTEFVFKLQSILQCSNYIIQTLCLVRRHNMFFPVISCINHNWYSYDITKVIIERGKCNAVWQFEWYFDGET